MSRNLIYLLYGVPSVFVYALTVVSIWSTRMRLSSTFVFMFLLTAGTNLITYLNTWMALRLTGEQWFFGYYEFLNRTSVISYIHQFLVGYLYFAQNINAFLLTLDRFFAISGFKRKEQWTRFYKPFTLFCHGVCAGLHYFTAGFHIYSRENAFVYAAGTNTYSLMIKGSTSISLTTQVVFGALLLLLCAILNILSFHRLHQTQLVGKAVKIVERSMFAISLCIFITQALNIAILIGIYYIVAISFNMKAYELLVETLTFTSDVFSLGPGLYTFIVPGPIRRQCFFIIAPWRKKQHNISSHVLKISVQTAHTF